MALYYWCSQGRVGNLLFQYAAIEQLINNHDGVICFNNEVFNLIKRKKNYFVISFRDSINIRLNSYVNRLFDYLVEKSIISDISPVMIKIYGEYIEESIEVRTTKGIFKNIFRVKGFFQHDKWIDNALSFQEDKVKLASKRLGLLSQSKCKVAVHVRLTDYKGWGALGKKDVTIKYDWYQNAMLYAKKNLNNPEFIFFSDDEKSLLDYGFEIPLKYYRGINPIDDLVAMSLCEHAIISPSTFAYCAVIESYYKGKLIIAPKYWAGFKSQVRYPHNIETEKMCYLEVSCD